MGGLPLLRGSTTRGGNNRARAVSHADAIQLVKNERGDVQSVLIDDGPVYTLQHAGPVVRLHFVAIEPQDKADAVTLAENAKVLLNFFVDCVVDLRFLLQELFALKAN